MNSVEISIRGVLAGLIISVPVGPVNVFCVSRAIQNGRKAGVVAGLGAASADTIYGAIAGFSIQFIIGFLIREQFWIRLLGGILLVAIGARYLLRPPQGWKEVRRDSSSHSDYVAAFFLNLTNPTTVLSFLAVLTALGFGQHRSTAQSALLVAGIFAGAMLWWLTLAVVGSRFQDRMNDRAMLWMNRIAGIAIAGFGLVTAMLSRHSL